MQADCGQYSQAFDESPVDTGKVVVGGPVSMPARKRQRLDEATDKQIDAQLSHIRKRHDQAGKILFETTNSWVALTEIFANVLRDPGLRTTYLVIDALDECVTDRPKLLGFIATHSSALQRVVKWIVSGRIWLDFEAQLERAGHKIIESDGAGICRRLLASTAVLYRPVTIPERLALMEPLENFVNDLRSVQDIINLCGSFLTLREDTVYFVHQSAKDFILTNAFDDVFPDGIQAVH
ncbi:hypothetical protein LTR27_012165 [Elasticomyces elasticus]|nr:hypothetical protein LTR27_012165 [Elasticomyces elasticus]